MNNLNPAEVIKTTLLIFSECAVAATKALIKNWIVIPASLVAYLIFLFAASVFGSFGIAGGFIAGFFYIGLLTFYYLWMRAILNKEHLKFKNLNEFDWSVFLNLISVGFLLWIISMLTSPLAMTEETLWVHACIQLGMFILLNALPEVVYIKRYESVMALRHSFSFIKDNWIEWFLPLLILFSPLLISRPIHLLTSLSGVDPFSSGGDPLFPPKMIFESIISYLSAWLGWGSVLLAVTLTDWFMLFRGFLFQKLDGTTRRRRVYQFKNQ